MAGSAGSKGLSAPGWAAIVSVLVILGAGGVYYSGIFSKPPGSPTATVSEPSQVSETASRPVAAETDPVPEQQAGNVGETKAHEAPEVDPDTAPVENPAPDSSETEPEQLAVSEPGMEEATEAGDSLSASSVTPVPLSVPEFDLVRAEADGTTLVAGTAPAGSMLTIYVDGLPTDQLEVVAGGSFVSFLTLGASTAPRVLTMEASLDGVTTRSADSIILAPTPQPDPVEVASAPQVDDGAAVSADRAAAPEPTDPMPNQEQASAAATEQLHGADEAREAVADDENRDVPQPETTEPEIPQSVEQADPAPAAVAVLRAGSEGVELVQPAQPVPAEIQEKIALDTISYSPTGNVQLAGRAQSGSLVRVYLDNEAVADMASDAQGRWDGELDGITPGIYTLRLDELDRAGRVLSRLETPFKREAPEVLAPVRPKADPVPVQSAATSPAQEAAPPVPTQPESAPAESSAKLSPVVRAVTVQRGDTLWAISSENYGEGVLYVRVFEANREAIRDPDLIYPGQVFTIPE